MRVAPELGIEAEHDDIHHFADIKIRALVLGGIDRLYWAPPLCL